MLALYRTLTLRYLRHRLDRAVLITLSIALGVGTFVSTRIINTFIASSAADTTTPLKGLANLYVTNGEVGVQRGIADQLRQVEGVQTAQPLVVERVVIPHSSDRTKDRVAVMLGVEVDEKAITENRFGVNITPMVRAPDTWQGFVKRLRPPVFISRNLYDERKAAGLAEDDPVPIRVAGKTREYLPVGVIDLEGVAVALGRNVVAMDIGQAASAAGRGDRVSRIDVVFTPGADPDRVRSAVEAVAGSQAQVRTPEMQGQSTQEVIGGVQVALSLCAAGAIVVGLFLVYNALSVSVLERRHDIGVMRSVGATRPQIAMLFCGEAIFLGLIGAVLGVPLGVGLADLAVAQLGPELGNMFLTDDLRVERWSVPLALSAMASGIVTALLAALIPSIQAASDEPANAVRRVPSTGLRFFRRLHWFTIVALVGGGMASIALRDVLPPRVGIYGGMVLTLVGLLLAMPLIVAGVAQLLSPLARWGLGIEARLAADNLLRSPGRTGLVVGAFAAGVALMFQIAGVGRSNEEPVLAWLDRAVTADAFLYSGNLASANSSSSPMEPTVGAMLREEVPGVEATVGVRYARFEYNQTVVMMIALDTVAYHTMTTGRNDRTTADLERFLKLPQPNTCIVSENFAAKHGAKAGDTVTLPGPSGPVKLLVLGTIPDYSWTKGSVLMDRVGYAKLFRDPLVDIWHVYEKPGTREAVQEFAARRELEVADRGAINEYLGGLIRRVYEVAYTQQFVVAVVAGLGIVTALLISVLQRQRELGLLRAVGATRPQVLKTVMAEGVLMGVIGTILGVMVGIPMEWYVVKVVQFEESGFVFEPLVPWGAMAGIGVGAIVVASVAGLLPALRAVRLRITEAIAYE